MAYFPLFSVLVNHSFFTDGQVPGLTWVPNVQSARLMGNFDLIVRQVEGGIAIFYNDEQLELLQDQIKNGTELLMLGFCLYVDDPAFGSYTEPTTYRKDALLYFDNSRVVSHQKGMLSLHQEPFVMERDFRRVDAIKPLKRTKKLNQARQYYRFYTLDILPLSEFFDERRRLARPLALINLVLSSSATRGAMFDAEMQPQHRRYVLNFDAKTSFWKYYILGNYRPEELDISDPEKQIEFEHMGEEWLSDKQCAITFQSKKPVPMQRWPELRLQLKRLGRNGGEMLVKQLPVASVSSSSRDVVKGTDVVVSEIYVNC